MSEPVITVEKEGELAIVTLNRPKAMNALSVALRQAIGDTFSDLEADPSIRAVIVTGAGKAFSAGLDLKELGSGDATVGGAVGDGEGRPTSDPVSAMSSFSGPIIGAINGVAITGGFELALACDVLIASSNARFADTHARVGVMPGWGLSQKLSRAIGVYRAKELSLSGNFLSAAQAADWGLVNRVVEPDELMPQARALANDMLSVVPDMLVQYKACIDEGFSEAFGDAMKTEIRLSRTSAVDTSADAIEKRRLDVQSRGKQQQS
jgi:enoyl-CoA hydratase